MNLAAARHRYRLMGIVCPVCWIGIRAAAFPFAALAAAVCRLTSGQIPAQDKRPSDRNRRGLRTIRLLAISGAVRRIH